MSSDEWCKLRVMSCGDVYPSIVLDDVLYDRVALPGHMCVHV